MVYYNDLGSDGSQRRAIGVASFHVPEREIGLLIGERDLWGKGFAGEVLWQLLALVSERPLFALIHAENTRSQKLFASRGFENTAKIGRYGQEVWRLEK